MDDYRSLTVRDIEILESNGCYSQSWEMIKVKPGFQPEFFRNVRFSGDVLLGNNSKTIALPGGRAFHSGIENAVIHNCVIEDNVFIANVHTTIANYRIKNHVVIENVGTLLVEGESSFGNGTEVKVINEGGGREVPIYDRLSAQTAYFLAMYRHRHKLIQRLEYMIEMYTDTVISFQGTIGEHAQVRDCKILKNLNIGPYAKLEGAEHIENGSINSVKEDPAFIGSGVIAKNFITSSGSVIDDGAVVNNFFLGQASRIGGQFSGENLLVFGNSVCLNGEAFSAFIGPFTLTDHKSSLIIAGIVSYWNAGSGTNQSNHLYKLGPIHQGIMERGCKTASNAYIMWPAQIGAFSMIMGRVYTHPDTSNMPFSYVIGNTDGTTTLIPGINLKSVGMFRDAVKWPRRDNRKDPVLIDRIHPNVFTTYTVEKMIKALALLRGFGENDVEYNGCIIKKNAIARGIELYDRSINFFLGKFLIRSIGKEMSFKEWTTSLATENKIAEGEWLDIAGMVAPREALHNVMEDVENGRISSLSQFRPIVCGIHFNYQSYLMPWICKQLEDRTGIHPKDWNVDNLKEFSTIYEQAIDFYHDLLLTDALKEFAPDVRISYGHNGTEQDRYADFAAVRGEYESHMIIGEIREYFQDKKKELEKVSNLLQS